MITISALAHESSAFHTAFSGLEAKVRVEREPQTPSLVAKELSRLSI